MNILGKAVVGGLTYLYEKHEKLQVSMKETRHLQGNLIGSLLQELRYTLWVLENNYKELQGQQQPPRGFKPIQTTHVEYIIFSSEPTLPLELRSRDAMEKYLRLANHHNGLIQNGSLQMGGGKGNQIYADWLAGKELADPAPMTMDELGPSIAYLTRAILKDVEMMTL